MSVHNSDIVAIFKKVADSLEIRGANPFRISAYRNAAQRIEALPRSLTKPLNNQAVLTQIPSIGKDLAEKIEKVVLTGQLSLLGDLQQEMPGELSGLMRLPSLGPSG